MTTTPPIIDANVTLGRWPTRRVPCDEPDTLGAKLRSQGVNEAWAGSYDGMFHDALTDVNNQLAKTCLAHSTPRLLPFGSINPLAPGWREELDRCATVHRMPGIRLHPNYHGYKLDNPIFADLLKAATDHKLVVQLTVQMEDARMMHPLMRVPPVDLGPLQALVPQVAGLKLVLLNALTTAPRADKLTRLLEASEVYVDIAMLEGAGGIEGLLKDFPVDRLLFGSHSPSFYFESATLKLQESALPLAHLRAICNENARRLLPTT